jgi:hypothetical protein
VRKKYCNFCGEPLKADAKECQQCGWDTSRDAPPSTDPGDTKARVGVAIGLIAAYIVAGFLIQGAPVPARAAESPRSEPVAATDYTAEAVTEPAMAIGTPPPAIATVSGTRLKPAAPISIKVVDSKGASVAPRDALQYAFELPETDQKCKLVGSTKGVGGFGGNIEVFLLTDDQYVFWHANPAAIATSSWETFRGSENTLDYDLPGPGTYHFVVSNEMSGTPQTIAVKAQVRCTPAKL